MEMMPKFDPAEIVAARSIRSLIGKRKWRMAYRAVDELMFLRHVRQLPVGSVVTFARTETTVTSLLEYRLQRSIELAKARNVH